MSAKKREKTLDDYIQEADTEIPPFRLPVNEEITIEIPAPSLNAMIEFDDELDTMKRIRLIAGDANYDKLIELLGGKNFQVFNKITDDIRKHFKLGESDASPA